MIARHALFHGHIREHAKLLDVGTAHRRERSAIEAHYDRDNAGEFLNSLLVDSINKKPSWLLYATPETRGILLYALTRHSGASHLKNLPSTEMHGLDMQVHALPSHKDAILNITRTIHTRTEWANVMQHMSARGTSVTNPGHAEGDVVRFLDYGWSLNGDLDTVFATMNSSPRSLPSDLGNNYLQEYLKLRSALMDVFPKGYEVVLNGTPKFEQLAMLDGQVAEGFCMAEVRGPLRDEQFTTYLA